MRFGKSIRKSILTMLSVCLLVATQGLGALTQQSPKVAEILITGNKNISDTAIRSVVANLKPGGDFSQEAMEKDRQAVLGLGYFGSVTARAEDTPAGSKVIYDVVEFPQIADIRIVGARSISTERLTSLLRSKPGQVFNDATFNLDIEAVQQEYARQGFLAFVSDEAGIDMQTGVATVPIIESVVQSIDIVGNKKSPDYVYLREMKTKPGHVLNRNTLTEDIKKIYNLGILDVTGYQRPDIQPGSETGKVVVLIPVKEMKTGSISLGLGYSSKQRLVGRAELNETNFRGRLQGLDLLAEIGQNVSSTTRGGNSYSASFREPWLDDKHTSGSISVFNRLVYRFTSSLTGGDSDLSRAYSERRRGGALGFGRPLDDHRTVSASLRAEEVGVTLPSTLGVNDFLSKISQPGPVRSLTLAGVRNTRDFDADPAAGWYSALSVEVGQAERSMFVGSDIDGDPDTIDTIWTTVMAGSGMFRKAQLDIRRYFSKGGPKATPDEKRKTLALRLTGGVAAGQILFSEQFFVGGAESLRGYREDRFWGNRMLLLSTEYRMPWGKSLTGVVFADYGDAWAQAEWNTIPGDVTHAPLNLDQHGGFSGNFGYGVGIRVITPIGPLRLDYGVGSEGARTHFSMGHAF